MNLYVTFSTTETQGLTVLEAMASSIPVLAIRDDSFIDAVKNKENGFLFKTNKEYVSFVNELYNNKKLYKEMCTRSEELSKEHSSDEFGRQVFKVYQDTIKEYNNHKLLHEIKEVFSKSKNKN